MRPVLNKVLYGSVEGTTTRANSAVRPAPLSREGSYGAHLVTIGGRVLPLRSDVALPRGGDGYRRASVVSFVVDEKSSAVEPHATHESG